MNCTQSQPLLSAYYDGELPPETRAAVARHVAHCQACAETLAGYESLSCLSALLPAVEPSSDWAEFEPRLTAPRASRRIGWAAWFGHPLALAPMAAVLLIAVGLMAFLRPDPAAAPRDHLIINLGGYLEAFSQSPAAAQDFLLTNYEGQKADLPRAAQLVGYTPAAQNPPPGYTVAAVYVLDMPCCDELCCRCSQVVLQRPDGGRLTVLEHCFDQTVTFGDRPTTQAVCCGKPVKIVEAGDRLLAATWRSTDHDLTIVGGRNREEIAQLVSHFESAAKGRADQPF